MEFGLLILKLTLLRVARWLTYTHFTLLKLKIGLLLLIP